MRFTQVSPASGSNASIANKPRNLPFDMSTPRQNQILQRQLGSVVHSLAERLSNIIDELQRGFTHDAEEMQVFIDELLNCAKVVSTQLRTIFVESIPDDLVDSVRAFAHLGGELATVATVAESCDPKEWCSETGPLALDRIRAELVALWQRLRERESPDTLPSRDASGSPIAGPLTVYIDTNTYSPDEQGEILSLLSELYAIQSGDRLILDNTSTEESVSTVNVGPDRGGQE